MKSYEELRKAADIIEKYNLEDRLISVRYDFLSDMVMIHVAHDFKLTTLGTCKADIRESEHYVEVEKSVIIDGVKVFALDGVVNYDDLPF